VVVSLFKTGRGEGSRPAGGRLIRGNQAEPISGYLTLVEVVGIKEVLSGEV
jgi:hypothetical protein